MAGGHEAGCLATGLHRWGTRHSTCMEFQGSLVQPSGGPTATSHFLARGPKSYFPVLHFNHKLHCDIGTYQSSAFCAQRTTPNTIGCPVLPVLPASPLTARPPAMASHMLVLAALALGEQMGLGLGWRALHRSPLNRPLAAV